ncbi:hypothetical protein BDW60DRAFT_200194 [Aspergillus nidulans var. acristatus]
MPRALRVLVLEALQASAVMLVLEGLLALVALDLPPAKLAPLLRAVQVLEATPVSVVMQVSEVQLASVARALPGSAALLVLEDLGLPLVRLAPLPQALLDLEATLV